MNIVGLEKLSLVDYPGEISATIFTSGCNLRCPFCHNGEFVGKNDSFISEAEVLAYLDERKKLLTGLCISGGEPTLQPDLKLFIKKVKQLGLKVKLDTNGTNPGVVEELIKENLIDYFAMDIKNSPKDYAKTCGLENLKLESILKSINLLKQNLVPYEFRTTLVKEFHTVNSIKEMGEVLNGAKKLVLQKFVDRDTCIRGGLNEVPLSEVQEYIKILSQFIEDVKTRGYI